MIEKMLLLQTYDSLKLQERIKAIVTLHQYATMKDAERAARKAVKWITRFGKVKDAKPPNGIQNCIVLLARVQKARAQDKERILKELREFKEADRLRNNPPHHADVKELGKNEQNEPDRSDKQGTG